MSAEHTTADHTLAAIQATAAPIGKLGAGFYFTPDTLARGKELGMPNGMAWYVGGRGSVLGNVDATQVVSAFGYFEPGLVRKMWDAATAVMPATEIAPHYAECARVWGRAAFAGAKAAGTFADLAEKVIAAAHPAGMALFAGWAGQPLGDAGDDAGRAGMACNVLRELRGSAHLAAVVAAGVSPQEAHYTTGGAARWKLFGYAEGTEPALKKAAMRKVEKATDNALLSAYSVLSERQAGQFTKAVAALAKAAGM
jgi:hypothetical protein